MLYKLSDRNSFYIDLIRILATLFVFVGHAFSFFQITLLRDDSHFVYIQNVGVVLLLLLSGFLSAHSMVRRCAKDENYSFRKYIVRRALRLEPELLLGLLFILLTDLVFIKLCPTAYGYYENFNLKTFVCNALMLENFPFCDVFGSGRQLWTLPVEWWAGCLFAFIFLLIIRKKRLSVGSIIILIILCIEPLFFMQTTSRGAGLSFVFLLGIFVYFLHSRTKMGRRVQPLILAMFIALIIYYCRVRNAYTVYSFGLVSLTFLLILYGGSEKSINPKVQSCFHKLQEYSYALYLTHYSVMYAVKQLPFGWNLATQIALSTMISLISAFVIHEISKLIIKRIPVTQKQFS